ncbi:MULTISPECIES: helix-turn-helix domain-containing protein [unclassified Pseudactinotalea]|uniref:helix-turn-helix domain-containing protein n=1 Tax=unclassified Pseudactinotalea TaxID=2649176 RepID=UPI00128B4AA7|nr:MULTISPECIES: helix-turn-helix transcriptional regulator [unclassified Pseudactinotalea]MPV50241.1 helix-turn-helix domain-containing protein [Pseudactinotalea sp. HY160]QGH70165.1 helix-turn-helix domain-containing protein [Pseudactinotalea sp. HY158]
MADIAPPLRPVPRLPLGEDGEREPLWRTVLGRELRRLRHGRGETLGETSTRAGVSAQYLSEMERGVKDPSSEMIAAVAGALGVSLIDLTSAVARELHAPAAGAPRGASGRAALSLAA